MGGYRTFIAVIGALVASLAIAAPAGAAIECGDEIKKDVKLKKNLDCDGTSANALIVVKDGVEIDLNGKKIIADDSYSAIYNDDGYDHLAVRDGTLENVYYGVYNYYGSYARFEDLTIEGVNNNGYGLYQQYSIAPKASDVTMKDLNYGWYGYANHGLSLKRLTVKGSDPGSTQAVYEYDTTGTIDRLKANSAYYGVYVGGYADPLKIKRSTANDAGYTGFYISNSTPFSSYRYILEDNTANDAGQYGFYASYDVAGGGNKAKNAGSDNCYNVPC